MAGGDVAGDGESSGVSSEDPVQAAIDELYSADPDDFMALRGALATAAKKSGSPAIAKQIAALRKPTRSAYTVNMLARTDPDRVGDLLELGSQLRDAERSVDAKQIRELTSQRRRLVDELTRRAFEIIADDSPSSAVRDEVVSTLTAALADESVAEQIAGGALVKPARWEGFGFGGAPDLAVVPNPDGPVRPAGAGRHASQTGSRPADRDTVTTPAGSKRLSADEREQARQRALADEAARKAQAKAMAEESKREALQDARKAADDAEEAVILATDEEQARVERLRLLEEQVADARRAVDEARIQLRRAEIRQRRTRDALQRLGG